MMSQTGILLDGCMKNREDDTEEVLIRYMTFCVIIDNYDDDKGVSHMKVSGLDATVFPDHSDGGDGGGCDHNDDFL